MSGAGDTDPGVPAGASTPVSALASGRRGWGDRVYSVVLNGAVATVLVLVAAIGAALWWQSRPSIAAFGWRFVTGSVWDEVEGVFGVRPFVFGTLYTSVLAMVLAVPISVASAMHLIVLRPRWLRAPITFLIELLAAIPSVIYGLWGIFVLVPFLRDRVMAPLAASPGLAKVPLLGTLLSGAGYGPSVLAASVLLAIMAVPFITAVTRDVLLAVPSAQREAAAGLGATRWETFRLVLLPAARPGIIGAVMLGFGRAFGETMAVTMVIGNQSPSVPGGISPALFDPGATMASALANKFTEATPGVHTAALIEIGLVLLVTGFCVNAAARLLVGAVARRNP